MNYNLNYYVHIGLGVYSIRKLKLTIIDIERPLRAHILGVL